MITRKLRQWQKIQAKTENSAELASMVSSQIQGSVRFVTYGFAFWFHVAPRHFSHLQIAEGKRFTIIFAQDCRFACLQI